MALKPRDLGVVRFFFLNYLDNYGDEVYTIAYWSSWEGNMDIVTTVDRGIRKGIKTSWELSKVMAPIYIGVSILGQTPVMNWLAIAAKPLMGLMGLPGEAATALIIGNVLNLYAAIGAIVALNLNSREVTVIALVLLISHNLFVETSVSKSTGIKVTSLVLVRIIGGILAGIMLNWIWKGWF